MLTSQKYKLDELQEGERLKNESEWKYYFSAWLWDIPDIGI